MIFLSFAVRVICFALSVLIVSHFVPKIQVGNFATAVVVALVYGLFNFIAYYVFGLFTLPFGIVTLGFGFWIVNTVLLLVTSSFVPGFQVASFGWAMIASALISVVNLVIHSFLGILFP
jgi:putative membrane protein